jgi:hypothetical protein
VVSSPAKRKVLHWSMMSDVGQPARRSWSARLKPTSMESSDVVVVAAGAAASVEGVEELSVGEVAAAKEAATLREVASDLPSDERHVDAAGIGNVAHKVADEYAEHVLQDENL